MNSEPTVLLDLTQYPLVRVPMDPVQYTLDRLCTNCGLRFWHIDPLVRHCGDRDCNSQNPEYKTYNPVHLGVKPLHEALSEFKSFFYNKKFSFLRDPVLLKRSKPTLKISSTDMNFMTAGISAFETLMDPANPRTEIFSNRLLISNQYCYRFYDHKNVQHTGRHSTGFFMSSLHCFESLTQGFIPTWKQQFLSAVMEYFLIHLGVPLKNLYVHGDSWTDGINYGPCAEIFVNGEEKGNCVFTTHYTTGEPRATKFLDVGLGGQRIAALAGYQYVYAQDRTKDHVRNLVLAFNDMLYPCKTGPGYNIRKMLQYLYSQGYKTAQQLKTIAQPVVRDLSLCTSEDLDRFYAYYDLISQSEYPRYDKYKTT